MNPPRGLAPARRAVGSRIPRSPGVPVAGWTRPGHWWLYGSCALLWASGLVLYLASPELASAALESLLAGPLAWASEVRHGAWLVHLVLAWVACAVLTRWLWPHWRLVGRGARHRVTGWANAALWLTVPLTGVGLQALPDAARLTAAHLHWWAGLALPAVVWAHRLAARGRAR